MFPQLFCTVCVIPAVISNFWHTLNDNISQINMTKKETPRIFLYRISSQISLQKYTWVSFFKICQVLFVCAHQKKPVCWQTTRSRELLPHGFTDCFPSKQPVLIISFSLMPNAVFTSYLIHHDLSMNVSLKKYYLMQSILFLPDNLIISVWLRTKLYMWNLIVLYNRWLPLYLI